MNSSMSWKGNVLYLGSLWATLSSSFRFCLSLQWKVNGRSRWATEHYDDDDDDDDEWGWTSLNRRGKLFRSFPRRYHSLPSKRSGNYLRQCLWTWLCPSTLLSQYSVSSSQKVRSWLIHSISPTSIFQYCHLHLSFTSKKYVCALPGGQFVNWSRYQMLNTTMGLSNRTVYRRLNGCEFFDYWR